MKHLIPEPTLDVSNHLLAIQDYYEATDESVRLQRVESELGLLRTRDILARNLPQSPAEIIDVGGRPAVHSYWLAGLGYATHLVARGLEGKLCKLCAATCWKKSVKCWSH